MPSTFCHGVDRDAAVAVARIQPVARCAVVLVAEPPIRRNRASSTSSIAIALASWSETYASRPPNAVVMYSGSSPTSRIGPSRGTPSKRAVRARARLTPRRRSTTVTLPAGSTTPSWLALVGDQQRLAVVGEREHVGQRPGGDAREVGAGDIEELDASGVRLRDRLHRDGHDAVLAGRDVDRVRPAAIWREVDRAGQRRGGRVRGVVDVEPVGGRVGGEDPLRCRRVGGDLGAALALRRGSSQRLECDGRRSRPGGGRQRQRGRGGEAGDQDPVHSGDAMRRVLIGM